MTDNIDINPDWQLPAGFQFSQSSLQSFVDCPRRFYLRYVLQQRWPSPIAEPQDQVEIALQRGARFHQLVERYQVGVPMELIRESIDGDNDLNRWIDHYLKALEGLGDTDRQWVEITLSTMIDKFPVIARYDFIAQQGKHLIGIDWKTGKLKDVDTLQNRMQTIVYLLVLFREGQRLANTDIETYELRYISVNTQEERTFTIDAKRIGTLERQLFDILQSIDSSKSFPKVEDENVCRYCVYRGLCERGTTPTVPPSDSDIDDLWLDTGLSDVIDVEF